MTEVRLTPAAAEACERACLAFAASATQIRSDVLVTGSIGGFGTLPSGIALKQKYTELTSGGSGSLTSTLQGHIDVATKLADTFRRMGDQYVETDEAVAAALHLSDTGGR
ncbi:hypothetical protein [Rhodococcoides corynebacterioides]|uniref:Excreted virulence factor EspC (Type VII ESX diderm) n=1 Tax=Rhodococcoides corynebacterioides TaxID=53972 RepID=A0ABS7P2H8_9NOCA|nr:hypothetical protein [Rhodococcus corynebacterioides]MBY6366583.1 hypothetical protein [Rhodococcus corynebacterioides]MBY6408048.1 hypothetical protein [Rhodococcus corynebacterioides]